MLKRIVALATLSGSLFFCASAHKPNSAPGDTPPPPPAADPIDDKKGDISLPEAKAAEEAASTKLEQAKKDAAEARTKSDAAKADAEAKEAEAKAHPDDPTVQAAAQAAVHEAATLITVANRADNARKAAATAEAKAAEELARATEAEAKKANAFPLPTIFVGVNQIFDLVKDLKQLDAETFNTEQKYEPSFCQINLSPKKGASIKLSETSETLIFLGVELNSSIKPSQEFTLVLPLEVCKSSLFPKYRPLASIKTNITAIELKRATGSYAFSPKINETSIEYYTGYISENITLYDNDSPFANGFFNQLITIGKLNPEPANALKQTVGRSVVNQTAVGTYLTKNYTITKKSFWYKQKS